jgi:hypothetical protein
MGSEDIDAGSGTGSCGLGNKIRSKVLCDMSSLSVATSRIVELPVDSQIAQCSGSGIPGPDEVCKIR